MVSNKNVGDGVSTKWGKVKWDTHIIPLKWFFKTSKMMGLREFALAPHWHYKEGKSHLTSGIS